MLRSVIGFVGLGNMGAGMAANLVKAGKQLVVFDVSPAAVSSFVAKGATAAASPAEVSAQADVVVTMLPSSPHVQQVYTGANGILSRVRPNTLLIDSSTIDPAVSRQVATAALQSKARMVDAPVSGGVGAASAGTLTFMVGGEADDFAQAKPLLSLMGKNIVHCGGNGTGQIAKVCNNLVLGISMVGLAEAMACGVKMGMDPKVLAGIINTSSGRCWSSDTYNPVPGVMENVPSSRGYSGGFAADLMKKDLGLACDMAKALQTPMFLGNAALQVYQLLHQNGAGGQDFSVVYKLLAEGAAAAAKK
eukprot:TRINITY_DN17675_c0_g1_i1.p2 TRINITY_DN17675_c0_g1~~TRINITY_DN17675_c0_g1_i1.p2  ORF type:complete len:305 (-),score=74.64 TRINITY_DN17675_c0_g1_i1:47-961(-)